MVCGFETYKDKKFLAIPRKITTFKVWIEITNYC
jgi:hypothetical protein